MRSLYGGRPRFPFGRALVALALVAALAACADERPPNILLISIDSLRADHLGSYGYERDTSPVLDRLAREGVRFDTVVSSTSWTLPAHVTLFTALPPEAHGVLYDPMALRSDALCLAEVLQDAGYATAGFVGGPFLRSLYGLAQGFERYDDTTVVRPLLESHRGATSPSLLALTTDWLDGWSARGRTRPFFVFLHLWDVHYDYTPPPPYDTMFDPDYDGHISPADYERGRHIHPAMAARDLEHIVALYDGEIRYTDHQLGLLLDYLREQGLHDQTLIVVTADHGDEFCEHGETGHRKNLYDTTSLVPLLIRYPARVPAGRVVERLVRLMDVAPTILSLAGVAAPESFGGVSPHAEWAARDLSPLLAGEADLLGERVAFSDLHGSQTSLRTQRMKLWVDDATARIELYDLRADPRETWNLYDRTGRGAGLYQQLVEWRRFWRSRQNLARRIELSADQLERLRALGYIR
jgi:arylsulfatase A-like enzyme